MEREIWIKIGHGKDASGSRSTDRHAWNSGGRSISSDMGFSLIPVDSLAAAAAGERRCQLGCHFEDGPPSFASFLRLVMVGQQPPSVASRRPVTHYLSICICTLVKPTSKSLCPQVLMDGRMGRVEFGIDLSEHLHYLPQNHQKMKERIVKINSLNYEVTFTQNIVGHFALRPDRAKLNRT